MEGQILKLAENLSDSKVYAKQQRAMNIKQLEEKIKSI